MKSTFRQRFDGLHVAIIMDGNGRWAIGRGRSRSEGHLEGQRAVRSVVRAAPDLDIRTLTLFAFSADNWKRPEEEVSALMQILTTYLTRETEECCRAGVRINVIGRRDRLAPFLASSHSGCRVPHDLLPPAPSTDRGRLFGPRLNPPHRSLLVPGRISAPTQSDRAFRSGCSGGGSSDSKWRRATPQRLSALGVSLC